MTATNFVFLLAVVTLTATLGFWLWQLRQVRKARRKSDEREFVRVAEDRL